MGSKVPARDPLAREPLLNGGADDPFNDSDDIELLSARGSLDFDADQTGHHNLDDDDDDDDDDLAFIERRHKAPERWNNPRWNIVKLVAIYYGFTIFGMNDSSLGALIKELEAHYDLTYRAASLSFLVAFTGYLVAALICDHMHRYLGMGGVSMLGVACQVACYAIASTAPPFALFLLSYAISGFGNGLIEAAWNAWAGSLENQNEIMGLLHGFYGLGGMICPAFATTMLAHGYKWNQVYIFLVVSALISLALSAVAFRRDTGKAYREALLAEETARHADNEDDDDDDDDDDTEPAEKRLSSGGSTIAQTFRNPLTWLVALTLFSYVGAEVSTGGWVTTFMIDVHHGDVHKMGYVATGFWTGITLGRVLLGLVAGKLAAGREAKLVLIYLGAAIVFQFFFWVAPALFLSALCAGLVGFVIGPLFPSIVIVYLSKMPKHLHVTGVGSVSAAGGIGGAVMPFISGSLATSHGAIVLGPFVLVAFMTMLALWVIVITRFKKKKKKRYL